MNAPALPVMVLAHNEEPRIVACLDSIFASRDGVPVEAYVLANGCTDRTEAVVREYARGRPGVHLVSIALADKCNAWNVFVHSIVPTRCSGREAYFFMNGDVRAVPGSFAVMLEALRTHAGAHAASAVPASGRNRARDSGSILRERGLVANLYALRGSFVARLAREAVRIPVNLEGDDGLIGALIKWDLAPERNRFDDALIVPCARAGFAFDSVSTLRPADWRAYWRRAVSYGRRQYEFTLLHNRLRTRGVTGLPADITELYPEAESLSLRWQGLYTIPNLVALRQMRRLGRQRAARNAS